MLPYVHFLLNYAESCDFKIKHIVRRVDIFYQNCLRFLEDSFASLCHVIHMELFDVVPSYQNIILFMVLDLDECTSSDTCSSDAECVDTIGSYMCVCRVGFVGDGVTCISTLIN